MPSYFFNCIKAHLPRLGNKTSIVIFGVLLGAAAYFRFWAAPLSAGADVNQFWAFAKVFEQYGLDFYRYADATLPIFPNPDWGYVYPPVWLLILRVALLAVPGSLATSDMVDMSWRVAMKTPIIAADLAVGCLIYWAVPGSNIKKLAFAVLWLFNPTVWYNSAVFGQFEPIAAVFLLASVILLYKGKDRLAFLFAGLAIMTKQHVLIPVIMMAAASVRDLGWRRLRTDIAILAGVVIVFSIPFIVTGEFVPYARMVLFPGQTPGYQEPLMYAFSGGGALLTYFHLYFDWNTGGYIVYFIPVLIAAIAVMLVFSYKKRITPSQAALVGFLIFISLNYRVNYQYLIIYIPLALWVAATSRFKLEKALAVIIAVLPAAWLWLFETGFWFYYLKPENRQAIIPLERLGWNHIGMPDYAFVALSVTLMGLYLLYIILAFTVWRRKEGLGGKGEKFEARSTKCETRSEIPITKKSRFIRRRRVHTGRRG